MTDRWFDHGVLVGYGSIGRAHARALDPRCGRLVVVDADPSARQRALEGHPSAVVVAGLDQVPEWVRWGDAATVVATWGPTHAPLVEALVARGARRVVAEKPLATSVADAQGLVELAARRDVALGVNYVRRYGREAEAIGALADRFALGLPVQVVVHGGARGLVTNGIHFVEMVCDLFGAGPREVVATARGERINPRSPTLLLYGGTAIWSYPEGRELVMSYSLGSSLKEEVAVYYRDAVVSVTGGSVARVACRPAEQVAAHPAVTRTGAPTEVVWEGGLPDVVTGDARIVALLAALRDADPGRLRPQHHTRALGACIGALASGESGHRVSLPVDPASALGRRRWPIS